MTPGEETAALTTADPGWAWARYQPSTQTPWGPALAAHLLRRAGFGPTWQELQRAVSRGPQATLDELLQQPPAYAAFAAEFDEHESAAARSGDGMVLVAWWLRRLCQSPWPLLEKATLFWHGHFAIRSASVGDLKLVHSHLRLLRKEALSNFPALLRALADDPAMYSGLGGAQNRKARPNLLFARAWLEAFTVGPAAATPAEVDNLARAWTGWFVYGGKLRFIEREHDPGFKKLLGAEGNLGRDDAVRILAGHPATAGNLARRLYRAFVSENGAPPDNLLAPLAELLERKASLLQVLKKILGSNLFFSAHAVGRRIKSPVELGVGLVRSLEGALPSTAVAEDLAHLGQRLDAPPTVHGWAGGANWINTVTMAARQRLCESLVRGSGPYGTGLTAARTALAHGFNTPRSQVEFLAGLLLPDPLTDEVARQIVEAGGPSPQSLNTMLENVIARPEFQLC